MRDRYKYYDLANAVGWFILAGLVYFTNYDPSSQEIIKATLIFGFISSIRHILGGIDR